MLVTGGAGAIGAATAKLFADNGAHAVIVDLDPAKAAEAAKKAGNGSIGVGADITNAAELRAAFDRAVAVFGGLDILVSNAGAAWEGRIGELDDALLRKSFELNFFAHQSAAQNAVRIMLEQGTGGVLLFNTSKQAVNPGAEVRRLWHPQGGDAVPVAGNTRSNTAPRASAPTRSMPTASAPGC